MVPPEHSPSVKQPPTPWALDGPKKAKKKAKMAAKNTPEYILIGVHSAIDRRDCKLTTDLSVRPQSKVKQTDVILGPSYIDLRGKVLP